MSNMDLDGLETSTQASWTDVSPGPQLPPAAGVPQPGQAQPVQNLDVDAAIIDGISVDLVFQIVQAKMGRPTINGPPLGCEVLAEDTWDSAFPSKRVQTVSEDNYNFHVRTDSAGGSVPSGLTRFLDAVASMSNPSTVLGPCSVRGVAAGKIMLSKHMDCPIIGPEVRHTYLVNVYLSYVPPLKKPHVGDGGPLRDLVFVPRHDEEQFMSMFVALSRLGHGPTIMPVIGCAQTWSAGRAEVFVRTQQHGLLRGPNGYVHATRVGAAGIHNIQANRLHPMSAASSVSILGDLHVAIVLAAEQLRSSLAIFKAVLYNAMEPDLSMLENELVRYKAKVSEQDGMSETWTERYVNSEEDAKSYANNVLALITTSVHKMSAWMNVPREVISDHHVFFRILSIVSPLITATVSFQGYLTVGDVMQVTSGVRLPFTCIDGRGHHVDGPWGKTKEDVLVEWVMSILKRVHSVLVDVMGNERVRGGNFVKSTVDIFVPSFEPVMQAVFLALMSERPGYEGGLSYDISDSSEHLFLSKHELSEWPDHKVQEYQIPFQALSHDNNTVNMSNVHTITHSDVIRLNLEVDVHKSYDVLEKMSHLKSFQERMDEVVTPEVTDVLYSHIKDATLVTDDHLELVPFPSAFWSVDYLSMTTQQKSVVKYVFYKRLSDVVSEWRNADKTGRWKMSFIRYK